MPHEQGRCDAQEHGDDGRRLEPRRSDLSVHSSEDNEIATENVGWPPRTLRIHVAKDYPNAKRTGRPGPPRPPFPSPYG
jgi:hypothetical protein